MDVLLAVGTTAVSVGFGLVLMWLACTAFFGLLMRSSAGERVSMNHAESALPHPVTPSSEPQ